MPNSGNIKRLILTVLVCLLGGPIVFTQETKIEQKFQDQFNAFKQKNEQTFDQFVSQNDSIFAGFLAKAWTEFKVFKAQAPPVIPKPLTPIIYQRDSVTLIEVQPDRTIQKKESTEKTPGIESNDRSTKVEPLSRPAKDANQPEFFGRPLPGDLLKTVMLPVLQSFTPKDISAFYLEMTSNPDFSSYLKQITSFSIQWNFQEWAYYQLVSRVSNQAYPNTKEGILFTWMALRKAGIQARLGYSNSELFLLLAFDGAVYAHPHIKLDSLVYYVFTNPGQQKLAGRLFTYQEPLKTDLRPISLIQKQFPDFPLASRNREFIWKTKDFSLQSNQQLIDYLATYPECEIRVALRSPLHSETIQQLDRVLLPELSKMSDQDRVSMLLSFVQEVIPYQTDEEQFGKENYLFADEVLYYPAADCEDRVALLGQLITQYTKCEWIGLNYPGHVSMAVALPQSVSGAYLNWRGNRFVICDPSYIGSPVGGLMPACQNVSPQIIE